MSGTWSVTAGAESERLLDAYLTALDAGVGVTHTRDVQTMSWLAFALDPFPEVFATQAGGVSTSKRGVAHRLRWRPTRGTAGQAVVGFRCS